LPGWWDEQRLRRAFENLVGNAIKYSPSGGEVMIRLTEDTARAEAVVSIEDTGIGVAAADLPHIFEPFYRGQNVDRRTSGTGIGLSGARQIVAGHGGTIALESIPGAGSTVVVRLPLTRPAAVTR
jgi:signal transduction histidine kinase